jgi:hypothetical protein
MRISKQPDMSKSSHLAHLKRVGTRPDFYARIMHVTPLLMLIFLMDSSPMY